MDQTEHSQDTVQSLEAELEITDERNEPRENKKEIMRGRTGSKRPVSITAQKTVVNVGKLGRTLTSRAKGTSQKDWQELQTGGSRNDAGADNSQEHADHILRAVNAILDLYKQRNGDTQTVSERPAHTTAKLEPDGDERISPEQATEKNKPRKPYKTSAGVVEASELSKMVRENLPVLPCPGCLQEGRMKSKGHDASGGRRVQCDECQLKISGRPLASHISKVMQGDRGNLD